MLFLAVHYVSDISLAVIGNQHESMLMIISTPCNCVLNGRDNVLTGLLTPYL